MLFNLFYTFLCLAELGTSAVVNVPSTQTRSLFNNGLGKENGPHLKRNYNFAHKLPNDTWDGHMHIVDPTRYPLAPDAAYTPGVYSTWDAVTFHNTVSMKNIIIVQPSIYGNDNLALVDALKALGPDHSRAIVVFDEATIANETLAYWNTLGVRGVRLNLLSSGSAQPSIGTLKSTIERYTALVKPFGWSVDLYLSMDTLPGLQSTILGHPDVKFCFDHFAQPNEPNTTTTASGHTFDPYTIEGFPTLIELLKKGNTYVKFSGPYRVNLKADQLEAVAKEILRVRSDRAVFASDWPFTRFEGLDIKPFIEKCYEWAEEADCVDKLFSTNAKDLWNIKR